MGDLWLRGVHKVRPEAGRHAARGPRGGLRGAPRERGLHQAEDQGDQGHVLLHHLHGGPHLRAGGEAQHIRHSRLGRHSYSDFVYQQWLGPDCIRVQGGE